MFDMTLGISDNKAERTRLDFAGSYLENPTNKRKATVAFLLQNLLAIPMRFTLLT
jgi:hypothetical protein